VNARAVVELWGGPLDGEIRDGPLSADDIEVQMLIPPVYTLPPSHLPAHARVGVYRFLGVRSRQAGVVWLFEWKGTK
jgi:hypothetical protein